MASVEPGTYRIVNPARNKALRVPNEYPDAIASWHTQDEPNQKWFVQRVSGGYRFKNSGHGRYLSVHCPQCNSRAYHGSPSTWNIIPQSPSGYLIQLEGTDLVLDLHDRGEVYIWPANGVEPQKVWKFERLGRETGEEFREEKEDPTSGQVGDTSLPDRSFPTDEGVVESLPAPLSPLTNWGPQIAQKTRELQSLRRQISEKGQEIKELQEILTLLRSQESSRVATLLELTTQLEELVETVGIEKTK
ncbi:hypothetical protein FRC11_010824 [Ceratobasidium sp. 423]|nr:hypothetical protein FRC11_010824 [Ceratobasidium sp. 423]